MALSSIRRSAEQSSVATFAAGQEAEGREDGYWFPCQVIENKGSVIKVHYEAYEEGKHNWVEEDNLRGVGAGEMLTKLTRKEVPIAANLLEYCKDKSALEVLRVLEDDLHFDAVSVSANGRQLIFLGTDAICTCPIIGNKR